MLLNMLFDVQFCDIVYCFYDNFMSQNSSVLQYMKTAWNYMYISIK